MNTYKKTSLNQIFTHIHKFSRVNYLPRPATFIFFNSDHTCHVGSVTAVCREIVIAVTYAVEFFFQLKLIILFIFRIIVKCYDFIIRPLEVVRILCNTFMSSETRLYCVRVVNAYGYTPKVSSNNYIPRKVLNILLPRISWFFPPSNFDVIWESQGFSLHLLKAFKREIKICFRFLSYPGSLIL